MVEQIVEAHGGDVHLDSTVGEGSTFAIRLPARIEARGQTQEQPAWRAS
jgi:signal transduction histidine kinase